MSISNTLSPLSPQDYVALRKEMITAEYRRMPLSLLEEEQLHLEALGRRQGDLWTTWGQCVQNDSVQSKSERNVQRADWDVLQAGRGAAPGEKGGPILRGKHSFRRVAVTLECSCLNLLSAEGWCSLTPFIVLVQSPSSTYSGNFWKIFVHVLAKDCQCDQVLSRQMI